MLLRSSIIAAVSVLAVSVAAASKDAPRPECVSKCWDYTQYVSPHCLGGRECLCNDAEYQNAVYQCLYSQCTTPQFANALHHALAICHTEHHEEAGPGLVRQHPEAQLKRRQAMPMQSQSNSAYQSASVTRSAGPGSVSRSASASVTRSATRSGGSASVTRSATRSGGSASVTRSATRSGGSASVTRSATRSNGGSASVTRSATRSNGGSASVTRSATRSNGGSASVTRSATRSGGSASVTRSATRSAGNQSVSASNYMSNNQKRALTSRAAAPTLVADYQQRAADL